MRKHLFIAILSCFSLSLVAQELNEVDTELWTGAAYKLRLNKKLKASAKQQFRINEGVSALRVSFTEFGLRYKLDKHFSFKGQYRFVQRPYNHNGHRFSIDAYANYKKKKSDFSFQYRFRFQHTTENNTYIQYVFMRHKVGVEYNMSKLVDPYVTYEIYYQFNRVNELKAWRLTGGLNWKLSKKFELTTFYRFQRGVNISYPKGQHVIGVILSYGDKLKKKKKNKK